MFLKVFCSEILPSCVLNDISDAPPPPVALTPATPLWFLGNPDMDFQVDDELSQGMFDMTG